MIKRVLLTGGAGFISSRSGHDLRYALSGAKMAAMGWTPRAPIDVRIGEIVAWFLAHPEWLAL